MQLDGKDSERVQIPAKAFMSLRKKEEERKCEDFKCV